MVRKAAKDFAGAWQTGFRGPCSLMSCGPTQASHGKELENQVDDKD